jgi:hypothetical protein
MTPQTHFMILAPILPAREAELRQLLASMNNAPGRINPDNALIPFAQFDTLHYARLLILDDKTIEDVRIHGVPVRTYPLYLAFLGDIDGTEDSFFNALAQSAHDGLRTLFACCEGFTPDTHLRTWMQQHRSPAIANYVNTRGRTVQQVHEEAALREAIEGHLAVHAPALEGLPPTEIHARLRRFVDAEKSAGRLALSGEDAMPVGWWIANTLHLIGAPLLVLLASPLLVVAAPFYLLRLRQLEKTDPAPPVAVDQAYSEALAFAEDHDFTNQYSALGSLKPGLMRLLTTIVVLNTVDYAVRHLVRPGRLGRVRTIHFARWVFVGGTRRLAFFSNYDGSAESYMDDFINKAGFGLNVFSSNGVGYPRTNWLVLDGCADELRFKAYQRRHTLPTQVWYKAYPGLTAVDLERNTRIRRGLESASMSDQEAREWLALL